MLFVSTGKHLKMHSRLSRVPGVSLRAAVVRADLKRPGEINKIPKTIHPRWTL